MDLLTQGIFGSLWARAGSSARHGWRAAGAGFAAGMAPDLDALIRSSSDSLLFIDYHRHFTHAIAFAPVGGLLVALLLWPLLGRSLGFARLYLYCLLGYLSHGLLDACTSYGTHLWWPFTDSRVALNWMSVIDPLFTLPVAALLVTGLIRRRARWHGLAMAWALAYLAVAGVQQHRAETRLLQWAQSQNLAVERQVAKPAFANLILWRGVLDEGDSLRAVAIRQPPFGETEIFPGAVVAKLQSDALPVATPSGRDLKRFARFSDGWLFRYRPLEVGDTWFVGDFRYAMDPTSDRPMWGIYLDPGSIGRGAQFERLSNVDPVERRRFMALLLGDFVSE